jgi:hypothetical protein
MSTEEKRIKVTTHRDDEVISIGIATPSAQPEQQNSAPGIQPPQLLVEDKKPADTPSQGFFSGIHTPLAARRLAGPLPDLKLQQEIMGALLTSTTINFRALTAEQHRQISDIIEKHTQTQMGSSISQLLLSPRVTVPISTIVALGSTFLMPNLVAGNYLVNLSLVWLGYSLREEVIFGPQTIETASAEAQILQILEEIGRLNLPQLDSCTGSKGDLSSPSPTK